MMSMTALEEAHTSVREAYRTSVLKEAAALCEESLTADPDQPGLLHLFGLLASRKGQADFAALCLDRAATLDPNQPEILTDLADLCLRRGRHVDAESCYRRALTLIPDVSRVHRGLALVLARQNRHDEAVAAFQEALRLDPACARVYLELGDVRQQQGQLEEALVSYRRCVELDPQHVDAWSRQAALELRRQDGEQALAILRQGLRHRPSADLHTAVGEILMQRGALDDAVLECQQALSVEAHHVRACRQLVVALEKRGDLGNLSGAWHALGVALERQDRLMEAAIAYKEALARKPDAVNALTRLGSVSLQLGQLKEARRCFAAAVAREPGHAPAHRGLGRASHLLGDLARGWQEFGWYRRNNGERPRYFDRPVWNGASLEGRTILLWADDDPGETIQMIRFADVVKDAGASVIVECSRDLASLVGRMDSVSRTIVRKTPLPAFDVHAPLSSIPEIVKTDPTTIPNRVPYLAAEARRVAAWRHRLGPSTTKTIGLVWAGAQSDDEARHKFAPLAAVAPLAGLQGVRIISLQLGAPRCELFAPPAGLQIERLLDESAGPDDVAALIVNLDLVITTDTMVAHLAGALARPVWTLLSMSPSWQWLATGDRSSWYPTMRLFRQKRRGDWVEVMGRVRQALESEG
jgi:tetratricopeptide (TPR) repeat protein